MSARKFKFISPGIFINEIDNSRLPNEPRELGPLVIGRANQGPALKPVTVDSFAEYVQSFGEPIPGGKGQDVWRNGNTLTPTYGAYAAQAWLKNSPTITFIRLLGAQDKDASTSGEAGWKTSNTPTAVDMPDANFSDMGGAYGLWVFPGEMSGTAAAPSAVACGFTGALAAIWYLNDGHMGLTGKTIDDRVVDQAWSGSNAFVGSDPNGKFQVNITGSSNTSQNKTFKFSLDASAKDYIRNVFNTNPTLVNSNITPSAVRERYWLGETYTHYFEQEYNDSHITASLNGGAGYTKPSYGPKYHGVIMPLKSGSVDHSQRNTAFENNDGIRNNPRTGWFFSQDLGGAQASASYDPDNMQKLFKFHALDYGEWAQRNIKIAIKNINYSTNDFNKYGSFDVTVRRLNDTDQTPQVLESFSNCNLNPESLNYVGRKIGTQYVQFNSTTRRLDTLGEYINVSKYVRIEVDPSVDAGVTNEEYLPFGVYGPLKYQDFVYGAIAAAKYTFTLLGGGDNISGSIAFLTTEHRGTDPTREGWMTEDLPGAYAIFTSSVSGKGDRTHNALAPDSTFTFKMPSVMTRLSASDGNVSTPTNAYWGAYPATTQGGTKFNYELYDLLRSKADYLDNQYELGTQTGPIEYMWKVSLDEVVQTGALDPTLGNNSGSFYWAQGARSSNSQMTISTINTGSTYRDVIDAGIDRLVTFLHGGSDGLDITEKDPFRNSQWSSTSAPKTANSYSYYSVKTAVDMVKDPEFLEFNLATIPGLTDSGLTQHLIETCERRADALAIIDLENDFVPAHENSSAEKTYPALDSAITSLKNRGLNSSYACAFYPFVQIKDTIQGSLVYMPSSVAALGAMSYTDRIRAPWFAPAGFTRGGLSSGVAGLPVVGVTKKLTSEDRDKLYDANINPIASFPNEGIVIFGQKTLQVTRSALDRINVRRLMIFVKKGISALATNVLFEPNVRETWGRFIALADPFLADVKSRFGLDDYKLVLDETTTTADLIDRNIMYAKVFLKPTRAIEFVAIDFIITNTGASFED